MVELDAASSTICLSTVAPSKKPNEKDMEERGVPVFVFSEANANCSQVILDVPQGPILYRRKSPQQLDVLLTEALCKSLQSTARFVVCSLINRIQNQ